MTRRDLHHALPAAAGMALLLLFACPVLAADLYVATNGSDTAGNGSLGAPFATLQRAVDLAATGDTIHLAGGVYTPTATAHVRSKRDLTIEGAGRGSTVIDGSQVGGDGFAADYDETGQVQNTWRWCRQSVLRFFLSSVTVRDLTIRNGVNEVWSNGYGLASGGAIDVSLGVPVAIERCDFLNCEDRNVLMGGGAIRASGQLSLEECLFEGNRGYGAGAVLNYNQVLGQPWGTTVTATRCRFVGNGGLRRSANSDSCAGAIASAISDNRDYWVVYPGLTRLIECTFEGNGGVYGGELAWGNTLYNTAGTLEVEGCTFTRNLGRTIFSEEYRYTRNSGYPDYINLGLFVMDGAVRVSDSRFYGNKSGLWVKRTTADISNSVSVGSYGADIQAMQNARVRVTNCTLASQNMPRGNILVMEWSAAEVGNCIITPTFGPGVASELNHGVISVVRNSNVQGWTPSGATLDGGGNQLSAPEATFVRNPSPGPDGEWGTADDDYGDLRLRPGSPCIDAGSNVLVPSEVTTDVFGLPRFLNDPLTPDTGMGVAPIVDMGAHEYMPVDAVAATVRAIIAAGAALPAGGQPLFAKLNAASACAALGDKQGVIDALTAFCNQVRALAKTGKLTQAQADGLLAQVDGLLACWRV